VIKNGIGQLRLVLGDDRKTPRYIETYPCLGCRFIGTVETSKPAEDFPQSTRLAGQPAAPLPEAPALMVGGEPELALLQERFARAQALWRALGETVPLSPPRLGLWREVYGVGPLASPMALIHGHRDQFYLLPGRRHLTRAAGVAARSARSACTRSGRGLAVGGALTNICTDAYPGVGRNGGAVSSRCKATLVHRHRRSRGAF
jgi:hypothetical protein